MNNRTERTNRAVIVSYAAITFSIISGLLYTPWLIQELGSSDYAIYTVCVSLMAYFTVDFGIGAAITRFVAKYRVNNEEHKINGLLGIALKLYLLIDMIALVALTVMYCLLEHIYVGLTAVELQRMKVVFLITGMLMVCSIPVMPINGVFVAFGRVYEVKLIELLQKMLTVGLICLSLLLGQGLYMVVLVNAMVTVAAKGYKVYLIHKKEHVKPNLRIKDRQITKELLTFSAWVAIAMIADKFFFSFQPTLLGIFSDSAAISVFAVATSVEGYVLLFADGLNGVFLPRVTKMVVKKEDPDQITNLMIRVGRLQLLIVSLFIMGIITQGKDFIPIWFGKDYGQSYYAAVIILIPCFVHLTQSVATETLYAANQVRYRTLAYVLSSTVNVALTALLAPRYGAIGAAIGIACGFVVGHELTLNVVYAKVLKLNLRRFFCQCHLKAIPWLLAMLVTGWGLAKLWAAEGRLQIILRCVVCGLVFLALAYVLYINKEEKQYIKNFSGKVKGKFLRK